MDYLSELIARADKAIEVAKPLTTKQRKKMKKSTFCGPGRSFPVNDCKHVGVAKAYLKRSKFSASTKKKIAACINRKAKALGCTPGKKAKAAKYIDLSTEQKQLYSSEMFRETREIVEESIGCPELDPYSRWIEEEVEPEEEKTRDCTRG